MTPFSAELYPVNYKMDKDLLRLLSQANAKYTEYKIKLPSASALYQKVVPQ